jgi:hypothetical protein
LTFSGALAVLGDAQRAAEEGGYADLWKDATITVIPADIAVRLALQPNKRTSHKDVTASTSLDIIPGADEREYAVRFDRKFADQGKVPVFYVEDLKYTEGSIPFYFNKNELLAEWKTQKGEGATPPKPKVLDLIAAFQYVLRKRVEELPILRNKIVFVPSQEAVEISNELKTRGLVPYKADRIVVISLDFVDWGLLKIISYRRNTNIVTKRAREALVLSVIFGSLSFLRISALRSLRLRPALCDTRLKAG